MHAQASLANTIFRPGALAALALALCSMPALAGEGAAHAASTAAGIVGAGKLEAGPTWLAAIALIPFAMFLVNGLCAATRVHSKLPAYLTIAGLASSFAITAYLFVTHFLNGPGTPMNVNVFEWLHFTAGSSGQQFIANFAFHIDGLTILWMLFVTGLATLIALYASEYMSHDVGLGYCRFFAAFSLFVFSMSCLVMADNLVLMFLGWEGVGLCSYLLIGYFYKKPAAVAAAKKAFIVNRIGDLGLLMAIFSTYVAFGTVEYSKLFELIAKGVDATGQPIGESWVSVVIPLLIAAGAFGKSAQLFFYVWLPDAMEGPTPVSALIHAATMVTAGVFLIARMYPLFTADPHLIALSVVAWAGTITALWAATIEMAIFDIKRVMGYSTISQLGFMFAGLGVLTPEGAAFHTFTHAFFKATLFLGVGAVMHGFGGQLDLRRLSGVAWMKGFGLVALAMLVGSVNLSGVPFTAGYFSKDMILAEAFARPGGQIAGSQVIAWLLLLTAGMTAYYTFRTFFRVYLGPKEFVPGDDADLVDHGRHPKGTTLEEWHKQQGHGHGHGHDHGHDHGHSHGHGHDHGHGSVAERRLQTRVDFDPTTEEFDPHPPGAAMKIAIGVCMVLSILAAFLYMSQFGKPGSHGGWVPSMTQNSSAVLPAALAAGHAAHGADHAAGAAHAHGTFLGMDPHKVMYYVSAGVGLFGILLAAWLHGAKGWQGLFLGNRTAAAIAPRADAIANAWGPLTRAARNKYYVDEIYNAVIVQPLWVLSNIFHVIDQYLVDGLVNLFGALPRWAGRNLRPLQSGEMHGYALGMAGGLAVLFVLIAALAF